MPFPTERISLSNRETAVILSGLNRIVNEFGTLNFTGRRAPDVINPWLKHKLQPRSLTPGIYESILLLRNRLASVAGEKSGKFRFTAIEYAVVAFAARVARRHCQAGTPAKLEAKLEIYRKRAKRRAVARFGQPAYKTAAQSWLCSSRWIRFNLLPLPSERPRSGKRSLRREQYNSLLRLAKEGLLDRCTELPPEYLLCKLVELAAAEVRRSRHSGKTVRKLLSDPGAAREFLFDFIRGRAEKRNLELHLKPEYQRPGVQSAMRGELFKAKLVVQVPVEPLKAVTPANAPTDTAPVAVQTIRSRAPQSPATESETQVCIDYRSDVPKVPRSQSRLTAECVSDWLNKYLERDYWEDVIAETHVQLPRRSINTQPLAATTIEAVQQDCRPDTEYGDVPEAINSAVDWLIDWALMLETNRARIRQILDAGLSVAKSTYKPDPMRRPTMNGFRFIEEIMKGNLNP